ncbi:carbohydrate-binding protein SusD [Pedobacter psychrophilus]|uniref:Carbohydrate-binding protein SusD n=1 Tax=Pedobacter psychrophilus TaxID=1826909 RepID=A0A179DEH0_9SPHI|nr:RagB/SusD family nutrient uptake outer membrane protein [Pedobacter psychrophilus]OAQ39100.1 carbohydrate-binding protein SusD [Pedobacter psychrophilus]
MKKYKNRSFIKIGVMATLALIIISSCSKDFLDRPAQGQYSEGDYPFSAGSGAFDPAIFEAYDALRLYGVHSAGFQAAVSIRSDDADKGSTDADGPSTRQFDDLTLTSTNGLTNGMWLDHYTMINRANLVLDRIKKDQSPLTPQAVKLSGQAEAKFIRAYAYFMMVRYFGGVPLIDSISTDQVSTSNKPRSTPAQVYTLIESDLQFAAANLPASWENKFIGRLTSGAANGLLAKVYITQKKWAQAKAAANQVIQSGQYDLSTPYNTIFGESGENSKESVFEVQASATPSETRRYGVQSSANQGVRGTGIWNLGNGFNVPSALLNATYEAGDPRKARTFLFAGGTSIYNEPVPANLPNPIYNHKAHTSPSYRARYLDNFGYWMNVRILRYADVVLMYAEASNEVGGTVNTQEALAKLELVRFRARGGNTAILPIVTTTDQEELRQAIRRERRVELGMEYDRFFDLVRWETVGPVLRAAGKPFVNGRDELLPIPQAQIDLSKGVLTQNPGF